MYHRPPEMHETRFVHIGKTQENATATDGLKPSCAFHHEDKASPFVSRHTLLSPKSGTDKHASLSELTLWHTFCI